MQSKQLHIVYKQIIPNVYFDFNDLVYNLELQSTLSEIKETFLLKIKKSGVPKINEIREELIKASKKRLSSCVVFSSLCSHKASTPFHTDKEAVLILNTYGCVCYNLYYQGYTQNIILEKGDAIYIPSMLGHSALPLTPRISLSYECEGENYLD